MKNKKNSRKRREKFVKNVDSLNGIFAADKGVFIAYNDHFFVGFSYLCTAKLQN